MTDGSWQHNLTALRDANGILPMQLQAEEEKPKFPKHNQNPDLHFVIQDDSNASVFLNWYYRRQAYLWEEK